MNTTSILLVALLGGATAGVSAQVTTVPPIGPAPALTIPALQRAVLPNGLTIIVARNTEVPVVEGRLLIDGGARTAGAPPGLATFAASMLTEGAAGRTALQLAEEIAFLGASINAGAGWENFTVSVRAPKRTFGDALALAADVVLRPNFASADVNRLRDLRLASFLQARDQPGAVAQRVFYRNVFPTSHPLHFSTSGDSASTAPLDSAMVRAFWRRAANPRRATLILSGDVTLDEAREWATRQFGAWRAPATPALKPAARSVTAAPNKATRVILVDKPDAAQSVILIGAPGVAKSSPDYAALTLMNTIMGGSFSSRLNNLLREQLGYSYGAGSNFAWDPVPGPFVASSQVRTNVTDSSLAVFFAQFNAMRDEHVSGDELERGRNYLVLGALGDYETAGNVASAITQSVVFSAPLSAVVAELKAIGAVTAAQLHAAARRHLDPSRLTVVVVGDIAKIRPGIEKLGLGPIEVQEY
ncbi:MAG: insulinase family protein [Gemmatimonadales bacterium]|nr:insulinase family protein [Gemmatimonadales bacterium]